MKNSRASVLWLVATCVLSLAAPCLASVPEMQLPAPLPADYRQIDDMLSGLDQPAGSGIDLRQVFTDVISGRSKLDGPYLLSLVARYLFSELRLNTKLLGSLIVLAVISALLQNLQVGFNSDAVARVAYATCHLVLITLALSSFGVALKVSQKACSDLLSLMRPLLPALIALVASSGAPVTAGLLSPITISTVHVVATMASEVVLPVIVLAAVLEIVNHTWDAFDLSGVTGLIRLVANTVLGLSLALFLGMMAVQKAAGAVSDGAAIRTAKFLSTTFIPVVGRMFSDAAEMVFSSSNVLKGAVSAAGALVVFFLIVFPLAKIASLVFVYRLVAALVQPLGAKRMSSCLNGIGSSLIMMCVALGVVAMMVWVSLAVIAGASRPY
ncbi:MAG: stage III sporulation protein AE [Bacillota bacterium]|nr:stage III sporulation protein AE [Bacillota bacterium]